jgi:hypothetical protein
MLEEGIFFFFCFYKDFKQELILEMIITPNPFVLLVQGYWQAISRGMFSDKSKL